MPLNDYSKIIEGVRKHLTKVNWNGYLLPYLDKIMDEYSRYLLVHQPVTRKMYEALPAEQRKHRVTIWGATWESGSPESKALRNILDKYKPKAIADATAERKAAGWTGWPRYLRAPNGTTKCQNGAKYNTLFQPDDYEGQRLGGK